MPELSASQFLEAFCPLKPSQLLFCWEAVEGWVSQEMEDRGRGFATLHLAEESGGQDLPISPLEGLPSSVN